MAPEDIMDSLEAVALAKDLVKRVFAEEKPFNVGLEELSREDKGWSVTIGFSREWDSIGGAMANILKPNRVSKIVEIDDDGELRSIKNGQLLMS